MKALKTLIEIIVGGIIMYVGFIVMGIIGGFYCLFWFFGHGIAELVSLPFKKRHGR